MERDTRLALQGQEPTGAVGRLPSIFDFAFFTEGPTMNGRDALKFGGCHFSGCVS